MKVQQLTQVETPTDIVNNPLVQNYIDFCATSGMVVDDDGSAVQMTAKDFAERLGVARRSMYNWQYNIPNFWDLVRERRKVLFTGKRESMVWRGLFAKAAKGDTKAAEMVLTHFTDYKPPALKVDTTIEVKGLADLLMAASRNGVIETREDENGSYIADDAGPSGEDNPALSSPS